MSPRPRSLTTVDSARPTCYSCLRPGDYCVCNLVSPFSAHCQLLILQHPHERKKYCSTTRILRRAIRNLEIFQGIEFREEELREMFAKQTTYLLYPSQNALDCREVDLCSETKVVVIDGTWDEAQKIVYRNPILQTLPAVSFRQALRSRYFIRKQPKKEYLSTLESITHLLRLNALAKGKSDWLPSYDSLLKGFDDMVRQQLQFMSQRKFEAF